MNSEEKQKGLETLASIGTSNELIVILEEKGLVIHSCHLFGEMGLAGYSPEQTWELLCLQTKMNAEAKGTNVH